MRRLQSTSLVLALLLSGCAQLSGPREHSSVLREHSSVVTTLVFGTRIDETRNVSDAEWDQFVEREIVSRLPDGFTIAPADGRWRGADGKTIRERSYTLLVVRRADDAAMDAKIEFIRQAYCAQFEQEAVLRIDEPDARVRF